LEVSGRRVKGRVVIFTSSPWPPREVRHPMEGNRSPGVPGGNKRVCVHWSLGEQRMQGEVCD